MIEAQSTNVKSTKSNSAAFKDAMILVLNQAGSYQHGRQITNEIHNTELVNRALYYHDGYVYYGGYLIGMKTLYQTFTYVDSETSTFIMKYMWDKPNDYSCLLEYDINASLLNAITTVTSSGSIMTITSYTAITELRRTMTLYTSPYSGGFDLKDTFRMPVACAETTFNITESITYFYGQKKQSFSLEKYDYGEAYRTIVNPEFVFHNGSVI